MKNILTVLRGLKTFTIKLYEFFMNSNSIKVKKIKTKIKPLKG